MGGGLWRIPSVAFRSSGQVPESETIMETFPAAGPVKTQIIGKETPAKKEAAERVQDDMNYQLTDVMVSIAVSMSVCCGAWALSGNAFKKVYFDPSLDRQASIFVPAEDVVVPYGALICRHRRVYARDAQNRERLKKLMVAGLLS
jgi:hypothetical protein